MGKCGHRVNVCIYEGGPKIMPVSPSPQPQIEQLRDQGFVVVPGFAPEPQLAKLNDADRKSVV